MIINHYKKRSWSSWGREDSFSLVKKDQISSLQNGSSESDSNVLIIITQIALYWHHFNTIHFSTMSNAVVFFLLLITISHSTILLPSQHHRDSLTSSSTTCPAPDPNLYHRPVIGILTHPGDGATGRLSNATDVSNIPASYVKFVEAAGARVIPLISTEPHETLLKVSIIAT